MLLGKLETPAVKVYQDGVFGTKTVTADYMTVSTDRFVIGAANVPFEVRFGNIITENETERFDILLREYMKMTIEELATWGTDDSVLLDLIAEKLGGAITEKIQRNDLHHTY